MEGSFKGFTSKLLGLIKVVSGNTKIRACVIWPPQKRTPFYFPVHIWPGCERWGEGVHRCYCFTLNLSFLFHLGFNSTSQLMAPKFWPCQNLLKCVWIRLPLTPGIQFSLHQSLNKCNKLWNDTKWESETNCKRQEGSNRESKEDFKMWLSLGNWKLIQWREIGQDAKFPMSGEP